MKQTLRPYQAQALDALRAGIRAGRKAQVLQCATGAGKTTIASAVMSGAVERGNRAFFIVDSLELVDQAAQRFMADGMRVGVIQGQHELTDYAKPVQVATIQTLRKRWQYLAGNMMPSVVVIDECHVVYAQHELIINECKFKGIPIIGLSATPFRKGLGTLYDALVVGATTAQLTGLGYLVPATCYAPFVPDLKGVKTSASGDWMEDALAELMGDADIVGDVVDNWLKIAKGRQTIVFASNVAHSRLLDDEFRRRGIRSAHIDGYERDPETRTEIINRYRAGDITVLCNVAVLCLDEQTEILTAAGWRGIDTLSHGEEVANWHKDGSIDFRQPRRVFHRFKEPGERMVSFQTNGADFRVTESHNMVIACGAGRKGWKDVPAIELEGKRFGWPKHGMASPATIEPDATDEKRQKARIRSLSYVYRRRGETPEDARRMAEEHAAHKALPAITPDSLSFAQCRFIGFWLADGTVSAGNNGGQIFSATQSKRYAGIIDWFDGVLSDAGISSTKYDKGDHFTWTFVKGTGGQGQRKAGGIYRLIPYLDKTGSDLLWGLNRGQMIALLEGFWYGDGAHGHRSFFDSPHSHKVRGTQRALYDVLQAVCVCRGISATIKPVARTEDWSDAWADQFTFSFCLDKRMGGNGKVRPVVEDGHDNERVWCVETDSGYIVTRRNGIVTVMGNCKGFDAPDTACVVLARPTKSLMLHIQMVGRGLRTAPGKRDCIVIDHAGNCLRNGLPHEDLPQELDDGKSTRNLDRKEREKKDPIAKPCGSCGFVSTKHKCPACGWAPQARQDVEVIDGDLYEITEAPGPKKLTTEQRLEIYAQFLAHARSTGKADGWAWHKTREYTGAAPRNTRGVPPRQPSPEISNWIRHKNIQWAKRRAA